MILGYNTNGLAHHDLVQAIHLLAKIGYESVAITIDHGALSPFDDRWRRQAMQVKATLDGLGMRSVIETGARYLLDPCQKHEPTLVSADRQERKRRIAFYRHAIDVARLLGSDCVSIWSGVLHDTVNEDLAWDRLVSGLGDVCNYAVENGMAIGFEPEPGMFIDSMERLGQLLDRIDASSLRLTLDIGHLHCQGETPIADQIRRWGPRVVNLHVEDMCAGLHEHRMFGEGEIDFLPVLAAIQEINYRGGVHVELSRHSHDGPVAARKAWDFLQRISSRL